MDISSFHSIYSQRKKKFAKCSNKIITCFSVCSLNHPAMWRVPNSIRRQFSKFVLWGNSVLSVNCDHQCRSYAKLRAWTTTNGGTYQNEQYSYDCWCSGLVPSNLRRRERRGRWYRISCLCLFLWNTAVIVVFCSRGLATQCTLWHVVCDHGVFISLLPHK